MKNKSIKIFSLAVLSLLVLASCGETTSQETTTSSEETTSQTSETSISSGETTTTSVETSTDTSSTTIPVAPKVTITNIEEEGYVGDTLQITYETEGDVSGVAFSIDASTAENGTITANGLVTFLKVGSLKVIVTDENNSAIKDEVVLEVKDTIIDASVNFDIFDYSELKQDDPIIKTKASLGTGVNSYAFFKGVLGKTYLTSATFNISETSETDTWSRVSLGSYSPADSMFHGTVLSPGSNFSARKIVTMDILQGNVTWGVITDRSQVWNQYGLGAIDFSSVKLTYVRDGNNFYTFINDSLYWKETLYTGFNGIDTIPVIHVGSLATTVTDMVISTDTEEISTFLSSEEANKKLYPTNTNNVVINGTSDSIQFKNNNDASPFDNIKDNAAKSIGDGFYLPANKHSKIEFDLTFDAWSPSDSDSSFVVVNIQRHDNAANEARSYAVGRYNYGFTGWNANGGWPGIGANNTLTTPLVVGQSYHVVLDRLMVSGGASQDCSMSINDNTATWGWTSEANSTGNVTVWFAANKCNATLSNIVVTVVD